MIEVNLNYYIKVDNPDWINTEVRDNIRIFLMENCTGEFFISYSPMSIVNGDGSIEIMDRSYLFIFFENKKDLSIFKLRWGT